jgi:acetyl-CoA carboxylase carboxyltransferase component
MPVVRCDAGGGEKMVQKHKARNKMLARERVDALTDVGSPFLELSTLAAHDMYDDWIPAAGQWESVRERAPLTCTCGVWQESLQGLGAFQG